MNKPSVLRLAGDYAPGCRAVMRFPWDDVTIFNLEGPVVSHEPSTIPQELQPKAGPYLLNKSLPPNLDSALLVLANNHLMDYGYHGLKQSLSAIEKRGWQFVGAGENLGQARVASILHVGGLRVGVLARCETQFGVATYWRPGVAPLDDTLFKAIRKLKQETDFVIVSVHAANELSPWPSPSRQDLFRELIDVGADVVHGHHSHVPQGWEVYRGRYIFYGLGNFCVDPLKWRHVPNSLWSISPEIQIEDSLPNVYVNTTEVRQRRHSLEVAFSTAEEQKKHEMYMDLCNEPLYDRRFLEGLWQEISIRSFEAYYADWLMMSFPSCHLKVGFAAVKRMVREIVSRLGLRRKKASRVNVKISQQLLWYHLFACESHKEAIATALGVLSGELADYRTLKTARLADDLFFTG